MPGETHVTTSRRQSFVAGSLWHWLWPQQCSRQRHHWPMKSIHFLSAHFLQLYQRILSPRFLRLYLAFVFESPGSLYLFWMEILLVFPPWKVSKIRGELLSRQQTTTNTRWTKGYQLHLHICGCLLESCRLSTAHHSAFLQIVSLLCVGFWKPSVSGGAHCAAFVLTKGDG